MAISIDSIGKLQDYLNGVLGRAGHHAGNVEGVALTLLGAVVWKSDQEIEVRQYNDRPANMIWFWVNGKRYVLTYNHKTQKIDLKDRTHTGSVIDSFDNNSTYQQIIKTFGSL